MPNWPEMGGVQPVVEPELRITMDTDPRPADAGVVLRVSGEIDIQTSPLLDDHLRRVLAEGASSITVDLGAVTFLDSTGLSVLIAGLKRCQAEAGDLRVVSPRPNVRKVFEVTGLIDVFQIDPIDGEATAG
jgi:anti-sigma B factor antagonist